MKSRSSQFLHISRHTGIWGERDMGSGVKWTQEAIVMRFGSEYYVIVGLVCLNVFYIYILWFGGREADPYELRHRNFVIKEDSLSNFEAYLDRHRTAGKTSSFREYKAYDFSQGARDGDDYSPLDEPTSKGKEKSLRAFPSTSFICEHSYLSIRSYGNYRYIWVEIEGFNAKKGENETLGLEAGATLETPVHLKAFRMTPLNSSCSPFGYVLLQAPRSDLFICMQEVSEGLSEKVFWTLRVGTSNVTKAMALERCWFVLEKDGFLFNQGAHAVVTLAPDTSNTNTFIVRGNSGHSEQRGTGGRGFEAQFEFNLLSEEAVQQAIDNEAEELREIEEIDKRDRATIAALPLSAKKRIISFGLYGNNSKYVEGAIRNAELKDVYFPGWTCRFYVTSDVAPAVIARLRALGAETRIIPDGEGGAAGMFWRFMALGSDSEDAEGDRVIVRDVDSRLNARDRFAVQEWVESEVPVHLLRDHVNHCEFPINGGMWGAVRGALPSLRKDITEWPDKEGYMADLNFLREIVWPLIKSKHMAHDSYCCDRYPHSHAFPTKRLPNYQHVGQVFDANDQPRLSDIDGFIRGVPTPGQCRKQADWLYG